MEEQEAIVKNWSAALRAAFPATIPVMTGYLCLGAAFGILLRTAGYGIGWSIAMSMICYCGSMQFVGVSLLTAAFDPFQALLMSVMVNARHAFYGLSMLEKYRGTGPVRPVLICTLTDETFSLVSTLEPPEGVARRDFYFWISLLDYLYWQVGCTLGNAVGGLLTFDTTGLDFTLTALFIVLLLEQVKKKENRAAGIIGMVCTAASLAVFGPDNFLIPDKRSGPHHHSGHRCGDAVHPLASLLALPGEEGPTGGGAVSGQGAAARHDGPADGVLLQECGLALRDPWRAGAAGLCRCGGAASVETERAVLYHRGHGAVHGSGAGRFRIK